MESSGLYGMWPGIADFVHAVKQMVPYAFKEYYWAALHVWQQPLLWAVLVVAVAWERWRPASPNQPLFSRGMGQDVLWYNLDIMINLAFIPAVGAGLALIYDRLTGGARFSIVAHWPVAAQVILTVFVVDFLFFFKHWMVHKVEPLWHFHAIHHSQREMNVFTDRRQHTVEHLVAQVVVILPAVIVGLKPYSVMSVSAALWVHTFIIHGNIRSDFGWLGTICISPQYHRIHHSIEPRHRDKNFGTITPLWDRLFGTYYPAAKDEYPATGVEDVEFVAPTSLKPHAWLADMGRQMWHPFRRILKLPWHSSHRTTE